MKNFLRYWLPLGIWMVLIFSASADTQSSERTSRILGPLLRWLWPSVSEAQVEGLRWLVRKAAHLTEYAILAWLWWRALRAFLVRDPRKWSWLLAGMALLAVVIYAATDEFHQRFVANRTGSVRDVCIDTAGGMIALLILWWQHRRRTERSSKMP